MATKYSQFNKALPEEFKALPQAVKEAVAFWAHNTFQNERHEDEVEGFRISVSPIVGSDYETYIVVRVTEQGHTRFQGWVLFSLLGDIYASLMEATKKAIEEEEKRSFTLLAPTGFRVVKCSTNHWEW